MIKIIRMLMCISFAALINSCQAEPWQKIVMFVLYFGYGLLNALNE